MGILSFQGLFFEFFQIGQPGFIVVPMGFPDGKVIPAFQPGEGEAQKPVPDGIGAGPVHVLEPFEELGQMGLQFFIGACCQDLGTGIPYTLAVSGYDGLEKGVQVMHLFGQSQPLGDPSFVFILAQGAVPNEQLLNFIDQDHHLFVSKITHFIAEYKDDCVFLSGFPSLQQLPLPFSLRAEGCLCN